MLNATSTITINCTLARLSHCSTSLAVRAAVTTDRRTRPNGSQITGSIRRLRHPASQIASGGGILAASSSMVGVRARHLVVGRLAGVAHRGRPTRRRGGRQGDDLGSASVRGTRSPCPGDSCAFAVVADRLARAAQPVVELGDQAVALRRALQGGASDLRPQARRERSHVRGGRVSRRWSWCRARPSTTC